MKRFMFNGKDPWRCFSKKEMRSKYPEMGYRISGEVTRKKGQNTSFHLKKAERTLPVQPVETYKKPLYKVYGYIPALERDAYVVVKKINLMMIIVPLIALILVAGIFLLWNKKGDSFLDKNAKPFESSLKRKEDMGESKILLPGFENLYMDEGTDELYVALSNPEGNPCYFQYTIYMESRKEAIFQSGLIQPGSAVTTVKMPNKMKKGTYKMRIKIRSYSLEDHESELNGGEMPVTLIVLGQ